MKILMWKTAFYPHIPLFESMYTRLYLYKITAIYNFIPYNTFAFTHFSTNLCIKNPYAKEHVRDSYNIFL